jgi:N-acetylneuraminic acid mutarotase
MRRNHISELIGSLMFIHGGIEKKSNKYLNDYWFLDLDKMRWMQLDTKGQPPPPLAYHCSTLVLPTEYKLHPNFSVYKFPEVPSRVEHSRSKNEGVFIYGGIDSDNKIRNELRLLKIGKKPLEWCLIKTKGTPPDGRVSATLNYFEELNVLILYGGKCEDQSISSDMFICDLENYSWNKVLIFDRSPADRAEHSSCINGKNLIIFGGVNKNRYLGSDMYIIELELWNKKKKRGCIKENMMNGADDIKSMLKNI